MIKCDFFFLFRIKILHLHEESRQGADPVCLRTNVIRC